MIATWNNNSGRYKTDSGFTSYNKEDWYDEYGQEITLHYPITLSGGPFDGESYKPEISNLLHLSPLRLAT